MLIADPFYFFIENLILVFGVVTALKRVAWEKKTALKREEGSIPMSVHVKRSVGGREEQSAVHYTDKIVPMDIKKKKNRYNGAFNRRL